MLLSLFGVTFEHIILLFIRFNICTMCLRSGGETTDVEGRDYTAFALSIDEA